MGADLLISFYVQIFNTIFPEEDSLIYEDPLIYIEKDDLDNALKATLKIDRNNASYLEEIFDLIIPLAKTLKDYEKIVEYAQKTENPDLQTHVFYKIADILKCAKFYNAALKIARMIPLNLSYPHSLIWRKSAIIEIFKTVTEGELSKGRLGMSVQLIMLRGKELLEEFDVSAALNGVSKALTSKMTSKVRLLIIQQIKDEMLRDDAIKSYNEWLVSEKKNKRHYKRCKKD